jgi:hypothetical protein
MSRGPERAYRRGLHCECGARISDWTKTGRCKPCSVARLNSDPEIQAARTAGLRRAYEDPEFRARMAKITARNVQKAALDPEIHAKWSAIGREAIKRLYSPEIRAKWLAGRAACGRKRHETVMGWCPPDLRPEYMRLCKSKRMSAAKAREAIEQIIAARSAELPEAIRWLNRIAPVTRQEDGTFRYGNAFLTAKEVISRAKIKGWEPQTA